MARIGVVFPGQGSQYVGMGKDFIDNFPEAKDIFEIGEEITKLPLFELCLKGPLDTLTKTIFCQPAIFTVNLLCWYVLKKNLKLDSYVFAGHSLGEYSAFTAAGVFSIEDGFYLVKRRAEIMEENSTKIKGAMFAIIGKSLSEVENLLENWENIEISNINSPSQIVVGGEKGEIEKFISYLTEQKVKGVLLKVSGAFHTKFMKDSEHILEKEIDKVTIRKQFFPVYCNFSGEKVKYEEIKKVLVKQITSPIRWVEVVNNMIRDGVEIFVEVGPKNVLSNLVKKISPSIVVLNVEDTKSLENTIGFLNKC